jgi:hypothetical protein
MANETWFGKPIEQVENIVINGVSKRVLRYNSKLYKEVADFLNEGRAVKYFVLPEHLKAEKCRDKGKRYEVETFCREVTDTGIYVAIFLEFERNVWTNVLVIFVVVQDGRF